MARLRDLLDEVQAADQLTVHSASHGYQDMMMDEDSSDEDATTTGAAAAGMDDTSNLTSTPDLAQANEETLAVDDAENPLQLLARASYFQPPEEPRIPPPEARRASLGRPGEQQQQQQQQQQQRGVTTADKSQETRDLQRFFASATRVNLDVGEDVDPISLGLATHEEGEALFSL